MAKSKCVVLGVTGGIAAYKSAELVRSLKKMDIDVWCIMTQNATQFLAPLTLETLSGHPVAIDTFERNAPHEIEHISLARRADLFVVAPCTANCIGKLAGGIADDLLTTTLLATRAKVLLAPAMNAQMWQHPAVVDNVALLSDRGVEFVGPASGELACGEEGTGRMAELDDILAAIVRDLSFTGKWQGKRVLVTAGPTQEYFDPVRYLSNASSGKMGYAIAQAALALGAEVTLVTGPTSLKPPPGANVIHVVSAQDMYGAVLENLHRQDVIIKAAAPADFRPETVSPLKIKKMPGQTDWQVDFALNEDISAEVGRQKGDKILVVFAAETQMDRQAVIQKMHEKNADLTVLNNVLSPGAGFGVDTNIVTLIDRFGKVEELPILPKIKVAQEILSHVDTLLFSNTNS